MLLAAKPMVMRWSYLGNLGPGGTLDWDGDSHGNIPASGHILPDIEDTKIYLKICEHARSGNFDGRQVDWGAHALKVNGPELVSILTEVYNRPEDVPPNSVIGRHFAYAQKLGELKYVALVAVEL